MSALSISPDARKGGVRLNRGGVARDCQGEKGVYMRYKINDWVKA